MKTSEYLPARKQKLAMLRYSILIIFFIIAGRLFQIQVLNSARYKAQAKEQQWARYTIPARRGNIYTSDGFPVASSIAVYTLYVDADSVKNVAKLSRDLAKVIPDFDERKFESSISGRTGLVKTAENLSWTQKQEIENLDLEEIRMNESYSRFYPENDLLSHVLGFVGKDTDGNNVGYYGIEQAYEGYLKGQDGYLFQERSALGDPILWGEMREIPPVDGSDIYLTIDRNVQFIVEMALKEGVERYSARSGSIIVQDPRTGAIVAMANYPTYNPADYTASQQNEDIYRNNAMSAIYEPGSVMKALTMSSAVDLGRVVPETVYLDDGPKYFSGHKVDNWDGKHHGEETMIEILQHSNNLGAAWVGRQVGSEQILNYLHKFGFGGQLGIDLEGEEKGLIYASYPLKDIELVNASFGQGISATPLQIMSVFSAIANKGYLMKPYVVSKITSAERDTEIKPEIFSRPVSEKTSETMVNMLTQAVTGGEAKYFVLKNFNIAGKTGTAQVPVQGRYDENKTNATFAGFLASYKNFVMLVRLEEPSFPSGFAAETAVPLWMEIVAKLANYYNLVPDK